MQTKKQVMKKIRSMLKATRAEILNSGAIDLDNAEDNFRAPKCVLTAAMRNASVQWSPMPWDNSGKRLVKNLERM